MLPFLTAYDPIGGSSGSIDPLGALQTYGTLADLLLPGVTTITTRSRYLSMLCASLSNAEKHQPILPGPSGMAQRRKAVEPFERLWALACVAAREAGHEGAADGLRGISYAEKTYQQFINTGKKINCDFPLLKFQSRTGAVGTYWTAMVGGQLVHGDSGALAAEGQELADQFPLPPMDSKDQVRFTDPKSAHRVSLPFNEFLDWAEKSHLQAAKPKERQFLLEALRADDRRDSVFQGLEKMKDGVPVKWKTKHLDSLGKSLKMVPRAVELDLPIVIEAIIMTEKFHAAVLTAFETLLWWGTQQAGNPIVNLVTDPDFRKSTDHCRETAMALRHFLEKCENQKIRKGIAGFVSFGSQIERCQNGRDIVGQLIDRHHQVQSGKVDGGIQKRDWIVWDNSRLLRPAPRFQITERPPLADGTSLTHPYRLEAFVYMLRENGVLTQK